MSPVPLPSGLDSSEQQYREFPPDPALRGLVALAWVQQVGAGATPYTRRRAPHGAVEIVCGAGAAPRVIGPLTVPLIERLEPGTTLVGVRLALGALPAFTGLRASELTGIACDAEELWGRAQAAALAAAVDEATSPSAALTALQDHVRALAADAAPLDPLVAAAVRELMPWRASDVGSVQRSLHISESQLRRRFHSAVGIPPKPLHRMLRFQGFLALVQHAITQGRDLNGANLSLMACQVGYSDQAHLTHECVRFTGVTPRVLLADTHRDCVGHDHSPSSAPLLLARTR
ncbi:helix-turn-helix domain-containing protein [Glycomyces artemisiae]|uniref:AraC family transcriptional regulator n=1 Tax=Glycomyces artemisiae TaxID=1076443 RepID=A0A2T0UQ20_9ACTN|nr:helix-turn-helix domain-containing protein [Glycomyces artemisiae]PRY60029.1 AraC family transcriptional regulator [Glycomyces artemisiae]